MSLRHSMTPVQNRQGRYSRCRGTPVAGIGGMTPRLSRQSVWLGKFLWAKLNKPPETRRLVHHASMLWYQDAFSVTCHVPVVAAFSSHFTSDPAFVNRC